MPKMKTHRGSAKRFSRTGTGKLKRHKAMKNHMLGCKTTKRKRQLRAAELVALRMWLEWSVCCRICRAEGLVPDSGYRAWSTGTSALAANFQNALFRD